MGAERPSVRADDYFGGWEMPLVESCNILSIQRRLYLTLYGTCCNNSQTFILKYLDSVRMLFETKFFYRT